MKKLASILLSFTLAFSLIPQALAYTDVNKAHDYYSSVMRLGDLGIISGYSDGTFGADRTLTRAEFTKIVVCMMDKEKEALSRTAFSGFSDVSNSFWATPYINYAVAENILSGYAGGTFCPDKNISYAEALTVLLRTLGYTEKEVGYFWPNNYINGASSLGITKGFNVGKDEAITRSQAAVLVDRTMFARPAGGSATDTYLASCGYKVLDDALVLDTDTKNNNISILAGNLKMNNASTYIGKLVAMPEEGAVYEYAVVDKDGYLVAVREYDGEAEVYSQSAVINKLTENTVEYTTLDGFKGSFRMEDSFVTYYDNSKMTFASAKGHFTNGADITFYGAEKGSWNIAVIGNSQDIDPILVTKNLDESSTQIGGININKNNLIVYRNGEGASLGDIRANDVVYYNTKTNIMDVYSKKVTGIYYSASPSKAYVESVTVGGSSYEIGNAAATRRLDASMGAFEIGDKVTLLLGKNNKVCFAVDLAGSFDYFGYGVVLGSESRIASDGANEGNSEIVTNLFMADGQVHQVVTSKMYNDYMGEFVKINYSNGKATLNTVSSNNKSQYTGNIDLVSRTIGNRYVLKDAAIIQLNSKTEASASCELLDFELLEAKKLDESQIINVVTANGFGDVAILFVKSLENTYHYGVVSGFNKAGDSVTGYEIFSGGKIENVSLGSMSKINTAIGQGVAYRTDGGKLSAIKSLQKVSSASSLSAVEGSRIKIGSTIYKMSQAVEIVDVTSYDNMTVVSIDDLAEMDDISGVTLYADKAIAQGGIVRVVTITRRQGR